MTPSEKMAWASTSTSWLLLFGIILTVVLWPKVRRWRETRRRLKLTIEGVRAFAPIPGADLDVYVGGVSHRLSVLDTLSPTNSPDLWRVSYYSERLVSATVVQEWYRQGLVTPCDPLPSLPLPPPASQRNNLIEAYAALGASIRAMAPVAKAFTESLKPPQETPTLPDAEPKIKTKKDLLNEDPFLV